MLLSPTKNPQNAGKRAVYFAGKGIRESNEKNFSTENTTSGKQNRLDKVPIKTSFQQIIKKGAEDEKEVMTKDEIEALRSSVIQVNRPRNPWFETQKPFRKSYSPVSNENQPTKHLVKRETASAASLPNVLAKEKRTSLENSTVEFMNGNSNSDVYQAKPVKIRQNITQPPNHETTKKIISDNSLKRYSSIATGPSLKQQLLQQQQNVNYTQENKQDFDISRALASDIKMLEQLEIEHLRRANNRLLNNTETQSNSSSENGSHNPNYNSDTQKASPIQRTINGVQSNNYTAQYNGANNGWYNYSNRNGSDCSARRGSDSGNQSNATLLSSGLSSSPSPSSIPKILCSPREQKVRPEARIIGRNFSAENSYSPPAPTSPIAKGRDKEDNLRHPYPICTTCRQPISEVILQALGMSYHASCFRCAKCSCSLDGVPFAVDTMGKVFCMDDYENMFIPACVACGKSISAINEFGQIIRVVFRDEEYHIDCFNCEGCGLQLSNEEHNRCYPISSHLLCRRCHVQWKRLGGIDQPITDL